MTEVKDVEAISFSDMYVKAEKISTLVAMSVVRINSSLCHVDGVHEKKYFAEILSPKAPKSGCHCQNWQNENHL